MTIDQLWWHCLQWMWTLSLLSPTICVWFTHKFATYGTIKVCFVWLISQTIKAHLTG